MNIWFLIFLLQSVFQFEFIYLGFIIRVFVFWKPEQLLFGLTWDINKYIIFESWVGDGLLNGTSWERKGKICTLNSLQDKYLSKYLLSLHCFILAQYMWIYLWPWWISCFPYSWLAHICPSKSISSARMEKDVSFLQAYISSLPCISAVSRWDGCLSEGGRKVGMRLGTRTSGISSRMMCHET